MTTTELRCIFARIWLLLLCCLFSCQKCTSETGQSIRLHPENGRYFEFRGKPVVLMGSTEHYASIMNLDFDFIRYLDEVRACGLNLTRVFTGSYRQYPGFVIEDTPLGPKPGRFIAPWARSNVPGESDGGNKFDLTEWNPAYFHRLHQFVRAAGERDIVVEVTLFCPFYASIFTTDKERLWNVSPMNAANHINGVGAGDSESCFRTNSDLLPFQKALVRKFAQELQSYDNIFFEIANEPYFGVGSGWEDLMIDELVAVEADLPRKHLIARNVANHQQVITNPHPSVSIFNFHYAYPIAAIANQGLNRVIGNDETGFLGTGDLAYRREAWEFMLAGGGLENHLDYSFTTSSENGLAAPKQDGGGGPAIRHQLGALRWCLESLPLIRCAPKSNLITAGVPSGGSVRVLGADGEAYLLYVRGGNQANLTANLPAGTYRGRWMDPRTCDTTAAVAEFTHAGGSMILRSPTYVEDAALLLFGGAMAPLDVTLTSPAYQTVVALDSQLALTASVSLADGEVDRVEFLNNDEVVGVASAPPYSVNYDGITPGMRSLRARLIAKDGRTAVSAPVKCLLTGPFHSGVNLNGAAVTMNSHRWDSAADALAAGMLVTNFTNISTNPLNPLYPTPDVPTKALVSDRIVRAGATQPMSVTYPLPNGTYDVFLCLAEGTAGYSRDVRVLLEGAVVAQGIGHLAANEWVNYGPYSTTITDGILNLELDRETKGDPLIANFSIYQAKPPTPPEDAVLKVETSRGMLLLSWPANVPAGKVETSTTLDSADWQPLGMPAADFSDYLEIAVPITDPRRFFRLRKD